MNKWKPINTAPETVWNWNAVDLWLTVPASPRSMGMADAWRVPDCWKRGGDGPWCHQYQGAETELAQDYITHWMAIPKGPK